MAIHQFYKKQDQSWFQKLLARIGKLTAPVGTIGPVPYITVKAGPNRKMRRHSQATWRRYGEAATKIAKRRDISMDKALQIAMGGK